MNPKSIGIQTGYTFGFTCLAGAAVYFYASNWGMLERWQKFVPLFALVAGLFALSAWLLKRPGRALLGRLALLGSCISFGIALAVIGQTYHSHADHYLLFIIWTAPALLYSVLTRWQPFYLLAYALGNTGYMLYFMNGGHPDSEAVQVGIYAGLALIQVLLLLGVELKLLNAPVIRFAASAVLYADLWWLSNSLSFEKYGLLFNLPLAGWLIWSGWSAWRDRSRWGLLMTGFGVSVVSVLKYVEIAVRNWSESFFIFSLLFVVLFVWANMLWIKKVNAVIPSEAGAKESAETAGNRGAFVRLLPKVLSYSVIAVGAVLGSLSLAGFLVFIVEPDRPEVVMTLLGLVLYSTVTAVSRRGGLVRSTLKAAGFCIGIFASASGEFYWALLAFAGVSVFGFIRMQGIAGKAVYFAASALTAELGVQLWTDSEVAGFTVVAVLCTLLFGAVRFVKQQQIRHVLGYGTVLAKLLALFILTFISEGYWNLAHNGWFIAVSLLVLSVSIRRRVVWLTRISFGIWLVYVFYKYYDTAWKLLHKSVSLAAIGLVIMLVVRLLELRWRRDITESLSASVSPIAMRLAVLLVILQMLLMSAQIGKSELLLDRGQTVKLELMPRDPRSLLQGDYVELRYRISDAVPRTEQDGRGNKVSVVLAPDSNGVYGWSRIYRPGEALAKDEVVIRGKYGYNEIRYGIESYFVPEGTGLEVERTAKYAEVRVAANGDAILVRLLPE